LILNPLWGRIDKVLAFLPHESRSVRSLDLYRNCIRWIGGVSRRIRHFLDEQQRKDVYEEFGIADEIENFTGDVIAPYVKEKSGDSVRLQLDRLDPAVIGGNLYRFRRMYFNLVMNSVDAMANRKVGVLNISNIAEEDRVVLRVRDNGVGMDPEKIAQLLKDRETLDGELHSLGFVFVRQTVAEFSGDLTIESEVGEGTTMMISFPRLSDRKTISHWSDGPGKEGRRPGGGGARRATMLFPADAGDAATAAGADSIRPAVWGRDAGTARAPSATQDRNASCGEMIYEDYQNSGAQYPGSIFGIAMNEYDKIEFFSHRSYDRYTNVTHEDLSPMCYQATLRGRLERDAMGRPMLTLKEPQSVREFFEFKNVPERDRSPDRHVQMVHDEYIRVGRKLIATGLSPEICVELTGVNKFFTEQVEFSDSEPFPLKLLARQSLTAEKSG